MRAETELWREIHKASESLASLAHESNAAMNRYRGIPSANAVASGELLRFADPSVLQEAYDKGARSLVVACDYALALDRTLAEPILSFSPWTCLRNILESCSMCIWMLDPSIVPAERATRSLNVQVEENRSKRTFLRKGLARNSASDQELTNLIAKADAREGQLRAQAQQLGIKEKRDKKTGARFLGFGDGPKLITDRIESTLKDTIDYSLLSPLSHGDTWAILVLGTKTKSTSPPHVVSDLSPVHALKMLIDSFDSIARGLRAYYDFYGYDIDEYSKMLGPIDERVRQTVASIIGPTNQSK